MKRNTIFEQGRSVAFAACALLIGVSVMQSCKDDDLILTGQPSWLGNSIYEWLQEEGNYKYTLRLIDDLGETEVLSHTGSRTLFVAADSAYDKWFNSNNQWGVTSYENLSLPQKRLLLKNSMIDNAYLLELMSNQKAVSDAALPEWGRTMRRTTATSYFDSVYVMKPEEMPENDYWEPIRARGKNIRILKDACAAPMIHFLPAYLKNHQITAEDLNLLTNRLATSIEEAWVNGVKVVNSGDASRKKYDYDITCKNGYIQKVERVIEASPNMALIIHNDPQMSTWSHLLDRFSAPYSYLALTKSYEKALQEEYGKDFLFKDSLFVLRYNSKSYYDWSKGKKVIVEKSDKYLDPYGKAVDQNELLKFDPGWNQYIDNNDMNDLHNDAGMMIVPTDDAVKAWWEGEGSELKDEYGDLDNVPTNIITELINVNMIPTFSTYVPSKFGSVLNDAKEKLGIEKGDIVECYMGCNGVVYKVNKVFSPALFSSVAYPALAHASTMNISYKIIDEHGFKPYLLSMDSKYALILPSNEAMKTLLDPATYGKSKTDAGTGLKTEIPNVIELTYDKDKMEFKAQRFEGSVDEYGNITKGELKESNVDGTLLNTLQEDLMNQLIIIIPDKTKTLEQYVAEGYSYFKTKGGGLIKVMKFGTDLTFQGGWQMEHDQFIPAENDYEKKNGKSYQVDLQTPMTAQNSVYLTLVDHSEFSGFLQLLQNDYSNLLAERLNNNYVVGMQSRANKNLKLLDNYNYTVYVPTNEAIKDLQDRKILPTTEELSKGVEEAILDSICKAEGWYAGVKKTTQDSTNRRDEVAKVLTTILSDFVRYHVQDHSVAIGMAPDVNEDGSYRSSTSYESMKRNTETGRFVGLNVDFNNSQLTVKDVIGNVRHVKMDNNLYNIVCREYWFYPKDKKEDPTPTRLFQASDVVIHQIDGVLMYENLKPWRDIVKEALGIE